MEWPTSPLFSFALVLQLILYSTMSTPLPSQSTSGFSISMDVLLLGMNVLVLATVTLLAIIFIIASIYFNIYTNLSSKYNQAVWLNKNFLPIVEEDEAAKGPQDHQESASAELSESIDR